MTATMPNVSRDLYPDLGPEQRAYLNREWRPSRQEAAELGPYPLLPETAAAVEYLQRNYVLPWPMVRERHLAPWVRDYFIARGARDIPLITPVDMTDKLKVFRRVGETRAYWAGTDYQNGLAGVPDAQYEEVFSHLQATVAALALEEPIKAGATVYMPTFPFGPASMRYLPIIKNRWLDLELLVLCEASAVLEHEGMLRLPPADPHPLAWDRFFREDTDWSASKPARPAKPENIAIAVLQARSNLSRCSKKIQTIGGRPHIRVEHYFFCRGRRVRGSLEAARVEGLIVNIWNDWIDQESETGWVEVDDHLVGKIEHPCPFRPGHDYKTINGAIACRDALTQRAAALAELHDGPRDR